MKKKSNVLILLLMILFISMAGCSNFTSHTPPGASIAGGQYEQAGYLFLQWAEGLEIMVWHDGNRSSTCGSTAVTDQPYKLECSIESLDGHVDWRAETHDGITAQFEIDNVHYDLARGTLFLIQTRGGQIEVTQLARDFSTVGQERESIISFAEDDPDISEFIRSQSDSEPLR
ncbi:MAG: hypothetical protein GY943_39415 [Chloroflexi bacterium]|nr:hypothetical protein [Chloroflexota bacterium]